MCAALGGTLHDKLGLIQNAWTTVALLVIKLLFIMFINTNSFWRRTDRNIIIRDVIVYGSV